MKKQFTLSDIDYQTLDRVALSCGLTQSQVIAQLIKRYAVNLEQLLSTSGSLQQPTLSVSQPEVSLEQPEAIQSQPLETQVNQKKPKPSRTPVTGL